MSGRQALGNGFSAGRPTALAGLLLAGLLGWATPGHAQADSAAIVRPRPAAASLVVTYGYGAPYGCGVAYARQFRPRLTATAGAGYDWSGVKAGLGAQYDVLGERKITSFLGVHLAYSGGRAQVTVRTDESGTPETTQVRIRPAVVARLRAGAQWQFARGVALQTALGHGLAFGPTPIDYLSAATPSPSLRAAVDSRHPAGLEMSVGLVFRLSH